MNRKVTSLDVALRAGVSQSAVSRVFSGASASKSTQKKVREAAEALGYRPNRLARGLITGRSRIIGLVVAYLDNQFYPDAVERLSNVLQEQGYHILIFTVRGHGEHVEDTFNQLLDYQVDGIIAASVGISDELTDKCAAAGIPVVLFNRGHEGRTLSHVTSNNRAGAAKIAEFLVAGGHTRIGHVSGWMGSTTGVDRALGFAQGLADAGATLVGQEDGMYRRDVAAEMAEKLVVDQGCDALFVGNDHMAFGVMDHLRGTLNLRIPDDVSIVGYDDVSIASWVAYDLTTLRQPTNRMVSATVDTLMGLIERTGDTQHIEIDGPLMIRSSARRPKG
ncbi:LacI family DNA-binding transcriptional regulator [Nereida sp. MMG025]|uniref:LacI family DNA-binding transcriptional regulator n=1 Tax=Nereida sp. MMG025 TaxID=2909981 RepID=UPI001F331707|nr:LacI family DNA-binding transcriptional regulator [Nereida sp. MMG025]MCF6443856.1 LacI family DNA-binding transcriptional regulator [Nereida sp. MMG025]